MLFEALIRKAVTPTPPKLDELAEARRKHAPTKPIIARRQAILHAALAGRGE